MRPEVDRLVGTRVRFETRDYPFDEVLLAIANRHLEARRTRVASLDRLHEAIAPSELGTLSTALYESVRVEPFTRLYASYIERIVAPLFDRAIHYQRVPGVRVHLPGTQTVQYHTDEWYGHGPDVVNFWIPLTRSFASNALWVAPLDISMRAVRQLEAEGATMEAINARLATLSSPVAMEFGEAYVFCARVVHGSERNVTEATRVSLDCRVILDGDDAGAKPLDEYYTQPGRSPAAQMETPAAAAAKTAIAYLLPKHGFTRFISAQQQRVVVSDYAATRGLTLVAEETEIRTMAHHPTLLTLARGKGVYDFDAILAFSLLCLPDDHHARQRIYATARQHGTQLLFAIENLSFPHAHGEEVLERRRARELGGQ